MSTLDVRILLPQEKHPTIFRMFDALEEGEYLTIINDHDPRPLMYKFKAERPEQFRWEVLETGPEVWRVNIHKEAEQMSLGDMVKQYPQAAKVFNRLKIDYCCHGKRKFDLACQSAGLQPEAVRQQIEQEPADRSSLRVDQWSLSMLCDFITSNHHEFVRSSGAEIHHLAKKVSSVHGDRHPELIDIYHDFIELHEELLQHLQKEEELLFPQIKRSSNIKIADFGKLLDELEVEHENAGSEMKHIRELAHDYQPPKDACPSFRLLYKELEEFEDDLYKHVHLENNILIPQYKKAVASKL